MGSGAKKHPDTLAAVAYYRTFKSSGVSRYMAARKFGISPSTLYRALKRKEKK